jgi:hypothetical protein
LLGSFDHIRPHPIEVDARDLRVPRDHRLQERRAHLNRLLDHVIEARMLQRRKNKVQVCRPRLRAKPCAYRR